MAETVLDRSSVPASVARRVISPASYLDEDVIYPALRWLREHCPLGLAEVEGYDPIWLVTRHADVIAVARDAKRFHNADHNPILNDRVSDDFMRAINGGSLKLVSSLTFMDPPDHARYRTITSNWFLPGRISRLEDAIRPLARKSVQGLLDKEGQCDFVRDFALHYPLRVIMTLFGVPPEDEPRMLKLTQEFFGVHDREEQRAEMQLAPDAAARMWHATLQDFYDYFRALSAERRRAPRDDLLSLIANATIDGAPIPDAEANGYYVAIATAGHDTTSSSIAGGMLGLIRFPDQLARLKADPALIPGLVDEAIRWTAPVKHFMRNATEDVALSGQLIRAGERLMLCYPSANRDETVFADPDRFNVARNPNRHLAFGFGPHMCLGQHLAKLEMRILFEELLPHLEAAELDGEPRFVETTSSAESNPCQSSCACAEAALPNRLDRVVIMRMVRMRIR